jgi:vancomycin resistance protein YoaR
MTSSPDLDVSPRPASDSAPTLLTPAELDRRRRRERRPPWLALAALALAVLSGVAGWIAIRDRDRLAPRTTVAGIDVGGLTRSEARRAIERVAAARAARPTTLVGAGAIRTVTAASVGARPLVDEALALADEAGPLEGVLGHLGIGGRDVPLRFSLDRRRVTALARALDATFGRPARDARVALREGDVVAYPAQAGSAVAAGALNSRLRRLAPRIRVPLRPVEPTVSTAAAERAAARAERLLAEPRVVRLGPARVEIPRQTLRRAVRFEPAGARVAVRLDPEVVGRRLRLTLAGLEREPVDARFVVDGDRVTLIPSVPGRALDVDGVAGSLAADVERRVHRTTLLTVRPELTTAQARALRVREPISSFTTEYSCCEPRVTNIQRAARLLDGTLIRPGETFSLNEALGRRTEARGFVEAPQIFAGRLEDAVGGGVSQVATTLYNAAFFAGLRLVAHSPHQFYISRYPMGREATVSWGGPELVFENDWPAGILLEVSGGETAITVRFFSSRLGRRVTTTTGAPYDPVPPVTRTVVDYEKPRGSREQVQEAGDAGFSVDYTRRVYAGDRLRRNERWTVDYDAKDAIIELGPR